MAVIIVNVRRHPSPTGKWAWFSFEYRRTGWHCEWRYDGHGTLLQFQEEDLRVPVCATDWPR